MPTYHVTAQDREYAQRLTKRIKAATDEVWDLLLEAWNAKAWASLGYKSWKDYTATEFDISKSRAYQLVNQGLVIKRLREASTTVDYSTSYVSEREARDIAPILEEVADEVREQVAAGVPASEAVRSAVEHHRPAPVTRARFNDGGDFEEDAPVREVDPNEAECVDSPDGMHHRYTCDYCGDRLS